MLGGVIRKVGADVSTVSLQVQAHGEEAVVVLVLIKGVQMDVYIT